MTVPRKRRIGLCWWNTSLSPLARKRAGKPDDNLAEDVVRWLSSQFSPSIIGLGEVNRKDLERFHGALGDENLAIHDGTGRRKGATRDVGLLFDTSTLSILGEESLAANYARSSLKIGERITFAIDGMDCRLHLIVSHWSSRLFRDPSSPMSTQIGMALGREVSRIRESDGDGYIVLMGDYNDDPFSPSLADHLLATRDRTLAAGNDGYLYNPFWRMLGERETARPDGSPSSVCGTYFLRSGRATRWFTFDQIMFSSSLLRNGGLAMDEDSCQIVRHPALELAMQASNRYYDHLPVSGGLFVRAPA